jgi:REP element-mobilizing transposase RayT
MLHNLKDINRKSYLELGEIYFWTATINNWQCLLKAVQYKDVIIKSLQYLSEKNKIDVFAFVIMPNHIHLIWRLNKANGKETALSSFLKYSAHEFKKILQTDSRKNLAAYKVDAANKEYEFWKRDSLATLLHTKEVAFQKLDYIHYNPVKGNWKLVNDPCDYKYSSAKFYESGIKEFLWLKDLREEF